MKTSLTKQTFFTAQQHLDENGIALYVEALQREQISTMPSEVLLHVEECEECKLQIVDVHELIRMQKDHRDVVLPIAKDTQLKRSRFRYSYRIAAVIALSTMVGIAYYFSTERNTYRMPDQQQFIASDSAAMRIESSDKSPASDRLADNFTPSPNLDDLVHAEFRSEMIEVISPEAGAIVQSPISFHWKHYEKPLKIKILTNREITILTSITQKHSFVTAKTFSPGLYYWKLETDDELLFVGKFFVR